MRNAIDALWPHIEAGAESIVFTASGCGMQLPRLRRAAGTINATRTRRGAFQEMTRHRRGGDREWTEASGPRAAEPGTATARGFQSSCSLQHGERLNGIVEQLLKRAGFRCVRPIRSCARGSGCLFSVAARTVRVAAPARWKHCSPFDRR